MGETSDSIFRALPKTHATPTLWYIGLPLRRRSAVWKIRGRVKKRQWQTVTPPYYRRADSGSLIRLLLHKVTGCFRLLAIAATGCTALQIVKRFAPLPHRLMKRAHSPLVTFDGPLGVCKWHLSVSISTSMCTRCCHKRNKLRYIHCVPKNVHLFIFPITVKN